MEYNEGDKMDASDLCVIDAEKYGHYIERFNSLYPENIANAISDRDAWAWMQNNIPFLDCSDGNIEEIYYFRWWTYRKHIKQTPDGFVVTEFLPVVHHAGKHNTINCPIGHQIYEGRWIKDPKYLDEYCRFMLQGGGDLHQYSCWFADAVYKRYFVNPDDAYVIGLLVDLQDYYRKWEPREKDGLFHYTPWMDGMEFSVSGNLEERFRPTLNSYMYADALAISNVAKIAGNASVAEIFYAKASSLKSNIQEKLWNDDLQFFATRDDDGNFTPVGNPVREAIGYVPWYFNLPDPGYEAAWRHINDPQGFCSPVGLTTAEVRHPQFLKINPERLASWDGAIWPYATSQTLTAMQNLIRNNNQSYVNASDYIRELSKYAISHLRDDKPSISEVVRDPYVRQMSGSEHYNHSTFCDLVITGAAGIVPRPDNILEVSPLFPEEWDHFCLDGVRYRDHVVTIAWDRTGERYGAKGFHVYVDKEKRYSSDSPSRVRFELSEFAEPAGAGDA
jgi:hypothetical protein